MTERARNRAEMPATAEIIDSLRAAGVRPAWGRFSENGKTVSFGSRLPDRTVPDVPGLPRVRSRVSVIASPSSSIPPAEPPRKREVRR